MAGGVRRQLEGQRRIGMVFGEKANLASGSASFSALVVPGPGLGTENISTLSFRLFTLLLLGYNFLQLCGVTGGFHSIFTLL